MLKVVFAKCKDQRKLFLAEQKKKRKLFLYFQILCLIRFIGFLLAHFYCAMVCHFPVLYFVIYTISISVSTIYKCIFKDKGKKPNGGAYVSKADIRKNMRRARNGPGRNQCVGGRVDRSKGFSPDSFDRVLLDAPCSALGLRPRLFAGEVEVDLRIEIYPAFT